MQLFAMIKTCKLFLNFLLKMRKEKYLLAEEMSKVERKHHP